MDYINVFFKCGVNHLPQYDFRIFFAQGKAESNLDPYAVSTAGAMGIMQIMPATGRDLGLSKEDLLIPEKNIDGGIRYMKKMVAFWESKILDPTERLYFALGSYNAGFGNIYKAYKTANLKRFEHQDWGAVSALCLPKVTGKHSIETINYVARIKRIYRELVGDHNKKFARGGPYKAPSLALLSKGGS